MKNVFGYSDVPVICISISGLNKMIRPNTNRHLMNMSNFCHKIGMRRVQRCVLTRNTCKIISIKGLPAPQIMVSSIAFTCIVNINGLNFS